MQLKRIASEDCKLEMTPMIDVTFLLLIFFMCTIKFKTLEGKLAAYLPKDVGVNPTPAEEVEKVEIKIKVLKEGTKLNAEGTGPWSGTEGTRYSFGSDRVLEFSVGPKRTQDLQELGERLVQLHKADPERKCTIDPRQGTVNEDVVRVLDAAINAGFQEITFVGSYE